MDGWMDGWWLDDGRWVCGYMDGWMMNGCWMGSWMDDNSGKSLNLPACVPGHHTPSCLHRESGQPPPGSEGPSCQSSTSVWGPPSVWSWGKEDLVIELRISFDTVNNFNFVMHVCTLSCIWFCATPWTVACQASLSRGFSRQEYWNWVAISSSMGIFPTQGWNPEPLMSPGLAGGFFTTSAPWRPIVHHLQAHLSLLSWDKFSNSFIRNKSVKVLVTQLCPTLCDSTDCSFCPWDFTGKNTGVGCHFLLQGIFPTQGLNPSLPHCRWIAYHLSHCGKPSGTKAIVYCHLPGSTCQFWTWLGQRSALLRSVSNLHNVKSGCLRISLISSRN